MAIYDFFVFEAYGGLKTENRPVNRWHRTNKSWQKSKIASYKFIETRERSTSR